MIKEYTKKVKHNAVARHRLTDDQSVPRQQLPPPWPVPPSSYAQHDIIRSGTSLWPVWVSCPCCAPSPLLGHLQPPHWQGRRRWKLLGLVWALLSNNENISGLSPVG